MSFSLAMRRPLALLLAALAVLLCFIAFAYWTSSIPRLHLDQDSFALSKVDEWQAFGGTWEIVQGSIRNDSDERGAKLLTGSTRWRNYSVEADVMLLGLGGDAGLLARSRHEDEGVDAYDGYYAGIRTIDQSLVLGRAGYAWMEVHLPLTTFTGGVQPSHWYHLKLLAYDCHLVAAASSPSQPVPAILSITDQDCLRSGRVGLRSYSSGGVWRNFSVHPATHQELEQMLALEKHQRVSAENPAADTASTAISSTPPIDNRPVALPPSPDIQPISSLRFISPSNTAPAMVRGTVILASPALFVQDSTGGIAIEQTYPKPLKVGDEVEVTGQVVPQAFSSTLTHASVRLLWEGTPAPAVSVTAAQAATGAFDATFIEVNGLLRHKGYGPDDSLVLDLDSGHQSFRAVLNRGRGSYLYSKLKVGSLLRLRGVCVVSPTYTLELTPFALLVRSSDDVELLAGPPWWNVGHIIAAAAALVLLAFIVSLLYHRFERMRVQAVVQEREHLAYEMHDTLAQSVAGIGFQLEAIRIATPRDLSRVHQQLDLARDLVRHSHAEARRSIDMLRPQQLESEGLLNALTRCARRLVEGGSVQVLAESIGEIYPLPLRIADTLYRIGQEALANAVRHADADTLTIRLEYSRHLVRLVIADDGCGFVHDSGLDGFGVQGMRKRALSIGARLQIHSRRESGTQVSVSAAMPSPVTFTSWPFVLWKFLTEHTRYVAAAKSNPHSYSR